MSTWEDDPQLFVGVLSFLALWAYAIATFGWFLGGGLGWIPAAAIAVILSFLWPVVILAAIALVVLFLVGA